LSRLYETGGINFEALENWLRENTKAI